jgi:hypothetical protein
VLKPDHNAIINQAPAVDLSQLSAPTVHRRRLQTARRQIRDARKARTAAEAIRGLDRRTELYGFTKGQFSILDLIEAAVAITGPAALALTTWTAATIEIERLVGMVADGRLTGGRWLIDYTMIRREPARVAQIRAGFGDDALRVSRIHAKWVLLENADWRAVVRTSMNCNQNPRFEHFQIAHDPELADFLGAIMAEVWAVQRPGLTDDPVRQFTREL